MIGVTENLRKIRDLLDRAALDAGRDPATVRLLAVSKKQPLSSIEEAAAAGQREFGENLVQEGLRKVKSCANRGLTWHFIGYLQTNKTRAVAENFDWVHSVDRWKTARRLSEQRPAARGKLNVCLQVNIDREPSKAGVAAADVRDLAIRVRDLEHLRLRGLMCLPAMRRDFDAQREPFARLRRLAEDLASDGIDVDTLSMGMTADFRAAIFEGATIVRIGTAIFGERK